jgi:two-component system, LytTR family, sensor kinase
MERLFKYKIDHALFWLLTVFFHGYTHAGVIEKAGIEHYLLELIVRNALLAAVIYVTLLVIIPQFSKAKNYGVPVALLLLSVIAYVFLKNLHDVYLYGHVMNNPARQGFFHNTLYNFSIMLFYLAFATTLHLSKQWYQQREMLRKIEIEKLNTELDYLKAQLNPHFLFNSINTIYFQIEKQNNAARETLSKFSDMLRYQLYECNGNTIAIEKEVQYLKNYVALQQLRKDENYAIRFHCADNLINFNIPPLLMLPFVENAFKHVSHFTDRENTIDICLDKNDSVLKVSVINSTDHGSGKPSGNGGIGLKNVKRRLSLLYGNHYVLDVKTSDDYYAVYLELKIDSEENSFSEPAIQ